VDEERGSLPLPVRTSTSKATSLRWRIKEGTIVECSSNRPLTAAALAVESAGSLHRLTMNLTGAYQRVVISPLGAEQVWMRNLDTSTAYEAMFEPESFRQKRKQVEIRGGELALDPFRTLHQRVSISNPALCTLSKMGGLTDLLMWLHKRIEEKGSEVGKVHPLAQTFLVSISSRMLVRLSRPIHLLGVHFSRFDMLTPY